MRSAIRDSVVVALALAAPVLGQSLNVDIGRTTGAGAGAPSAAFGGAAEQPGVWNDITGTTTGPFTLVGLDGAPTGVTLTRSSGSGGSFGSNNPNTSGDYEKLLDDGQDVGGAGSSRIYTFNGLAAGAYVVYTYAVAPDNDTYISNVTVSGSPGPNPQGVGGVIPVDAFTAGITHAAHYVVLTSGAILTVTIATGSGFGTVNGFQLVGTSTVTLTSVDPPQHDFEGGSRIYVHGSGLSAGLEARINGETVANLTYIHPTLLTGLVPPNPVGTYDLVLRNPAAGVTLGVLPNAMQYVSAKLPPPEDVSAVRTAANTIKLAWSNPTINDSIQIKRNGALIATLPGNATEYNDILPFPPTSPTQYEMSSSSGARTSQIVLVRTTPYRDECLPFLGTGGSGRASGIWSAMIENFELQMCFHLENDAPALAIQVFAARVRAESQLKCRIRAFDAPHDVLGPAYDNIPVSSLELFRERYTQAILGQPLAAGDYLIGFYADPPSAAHQWAFELQLDGDAEYPGAPCPPAFYPMLSLTPLCANIPPAVSDISLDRPAIGGDVLDFDRLPFGLLPVPELGYTLRAVAADADGTVIRYGWAVTYVGEGHEDDCAVPGVCSMAANTDGDSTYYEFPFSGEWVVGVTVTDDAGATGFAAETLFIVPFVVPPSCGEPPSISHPDPDPNCPVDIVRFIPDITGDASVEQDYSVVITPASCAGVSVTLTDVDMVMVAPVSGVISMPIADPSLPAGQPNDGSTEWSATFNMSALPAEDATILRVTAYDSQGLQRMQEFTIPLCPLPPIYDSDSNDIAFIESTITYDPGSNRYDAEATLPPGQILNCPFDITDLGVHLDNIIDAHLTLQQYLDDGYWHPQSLKGRMQATLMSYDLFDKDFEVNLDGPLSYACDRYEVRYEQNNIPVFSDDWSWELFDSTLWEGFVGPVHVRVRGSLDVGLGLDVNIEHLNVIVRTVEEAGEPVIEIGVLVVPEVTAWAAGEIRVEVFWGLASASVLLRPSISIAIPIDLGAEVPPFVLNVSVDDCFRLALDVKVRGCVFGACASTAWINIFSEDFGSGCTEGGGGGPQGPPQEPSDLKYPSIAVAPDGSKALVVKVKDIDPDPAVYTPELYYVLDTGMGFGVPAAMFMPADAFSQRDSSVVFLSNTKALAVWTQGRLTQAQEIALPQTPAGANTAFKNQDIAFALWDSVTGWAAAQFLTNDTAATTLIPDGRPVVAPILNNVANPNSAWVAWVRSDNENMIYTADVPPNIVAGDTVLSGMSIFARKIFNGAPSGAAIKVSAGDEANPAADIQPTIAVSPSGNVVIVVWVRDLDANFDTPGDHMLMYSVKAGAAAFTAPQAITNPAVLPGVMMPSVALSSDTAGMLAFAARQQKAGNVAGDGNKDLIYAARITGAAFQTPVPLQRIPQIRDRQTFDGVYGRDPSVRFMDATNAAIVFRSFDGFGRYGGDGELGIATIDLSQPLPRWTYARDLTNDDARDWDISAAVAPNGVIRTVRDSSAGAPANDNLVFQDISTAPDLAVDRIRLSNPYTPAGNDVTLTVVVRNGGLRTPTPSSAMLHIGKVVNNVFQQFTVIPFVFTAAPDQVQTFEYVLLVPEQTTHLRAFVDPVAGEALTTNNTADVTLGVLPPTGLQCGDAAVAVIGDFVRPRVSLKWNNAERYESVLLYRNGRLIADLPGKSETYTDGEVGPGNHEWEVRGRIGLAQSEPHAAACQHLVRLPGDGNNDGDVDLGDLAAFDACLTGPNPATLPSGCAAFDFDQDADVDLRDVAVLMIDFTG